jgi:hypothetical protein
MRSVGLTPAGGQTWEQECHADWSRYLNCQGCRAVEEDGRIFFPFFHFEGSTLSRVAEYARQDPLQENIRIRMKIRELRPWKATYWKTLPSGYRITCRYRLGSEENPSWWRRDYPRIDMKWYQDPPRDPEVSS